MIGTTLHERNRLEEELGRGGMGTVYRAYASPFLLSAPVFAADPARRPAVR